MGSGQRRAPPQAHPPPSKPLEYPRSFKSSASGVADFDDTSSASSSSGVGEDEPYEAENSQETAEQHQHQQRQPLLCLEKEGGPDAAVKNTSELWHIHGRHFDLTPFLDYHPGGSSILEAMKGAEDITPVFESYHALAHSAAIRQSLEKFEWTGKLVDDVSEREAALVGGTRKEPVRYRWDEGGFYAVLTARVKAYFLEKHGRAGVDPRKASVNRFVKAPPAWYLKELLILVVYLPLFSCMLGYNVLGTGLAEAPPPPPLWVRATAAVLAGALLQSFSFCTLHDASHYGLFFKRPRVQEVISRLCNAWTLWHHGLWVMHHVYGHHSFTGDPERDPDLVHARPYLRKSILAPAEQYDPFLVKWQRFFAPAFMMVMPGASLGQTQAYFRGLREGNLWHVSITAASGGTRWYEYVTYAVAVGLHVLGGSVWVSFCYFMGISVAYHLCVAPDHDTFESSVVNSIEAKREEERQREVTTTTTSSASSSSNSSSSSSSSSSSNSSECVQKQENSVAATGEGGGGFGGRRRLGQGQGAREETIEAAKVAVAAPEAPATEVAPVAGVCESCDSAGGGGGVVDGAGQKARAGGSAGGERRGGSSSAKGETEEEEGYGDDWGEVQVRHSGNFSNGNAFVTHVMGGINYQIEHHLFPSMSHMLYAEIAPIVKDACEEFSIPYNAHPTLWSAYASYLKHLVVCSEMS